MPMSTAPPTVTKPQAGVITTRPATAPEQKPRMLGLPLTIHSTIGQTNEATAVAMVVVMKAFAATTSAAPAEPALKPYQPTQSIPVPTMQSTMLCGGMGCLPKPRRLQRVMRRMSADQPELIGTAVPPAKSIAWVEDALFHTPLM